MVDADHADIQRACGTELPVSLSFFSMPHTYTHAHTLALALDRLSLLRYSMFLYQGREGGAAWLK